ncbi:MAG: DUF302 domain-containing protein [Thiobacillus sp.]
MRTPLFAVLAVVLGTLSLSVSTGWATVPPANQAAPTDVYKIAIDRDISLVDAADSMRLRANALNLKLVAELALSKQVEAVTNQAQRTVTIFQFCDAVTAKDLIDLNLDFSVYMPCRIALIEDANGQGWLVMMDVNVDAVAKEKRLPQVLKNRINEVRQSLVDIMQAGAKGEL